MANTQLIDLAKSIVSSLAYCAPEQRVMLVRDKLASSIADIAAAQEWQPVPACTGETVIRTPTPTA